MWNSDSLISVWALRNKWKTEMGTEVWKSPHSHDCTSIISGKLRLTLSLYQKLSGGNFTRASWLSSLCYCFLCIIVLPTCCHSNWKTKWKDRFRGDISELSWKHMECLCLPSFGIFKHTKKSLNRNTLLSRLYFHVKNHFKYTYHQIFVDITANKSLKCSLFLQDLDRG